MQKLLREESVLNNGSAESSRERSGGKAHQHSNTESSATPFDHLLRNVHAAERELQQTESALRRTAQAAIAKNTPGGADIAGVSEAEKQTKIARVRLKNAYEILIRTDFMFSAQHGIDDKLWRNVFYARIEELRSALRKSSSPANTLHFRLELRENIDMGSGFYHLLLDHLRKGSVGSSVENKERASNASGPDDDSEADILAQIENFGFGQHGAEEAIEYLNFQAQAPKDNTHLVLANTLQRCLIALGDLARYQEILTSTATVNDSNGVIGAAEMKFELARRYYEKGRRVCPDNGKAHAQLAIIENLRGRDLGTVFWHMLSLATKNPSNVCRENLRSFYSRYHHRPPQSPQQSGGKISEETKSKEEVDGGDEFEDVGGETEATEVAGDPNTAMALDKFAVAALMLHRQVFFDQFQGQESNSSFTHNALHHLRVLASAIFSDTVGTFTMTVLVAVKKVLVIYSLTIWYLQMRFQKAADNASARQSIRAYQSCAAGFAFDICRVMSDSIIRAFQKSPSPNSSLSSLRPFSATSLDSSTSPSLTASLLSPVAIWSDFCAGNSYLLCQLYSNVAEDGSSKSLPELPEETLQQKCQMFFKAVHEICTFLMHTKSCEASRIAVPEDVDLMGSVPFRQLQSETRSIRTRSKYSRGYLGNDDDGILLEERLRRVLGAGLKFAKMDAFPFLKIGETEGTFIVIDEEAKKRERERQMRAMAQQLLKQQVDDLEHNLDCMGTSLTKSSSSSLPVKGSRSIRTIVLDVSILLDHVGIVNRIFQSGAFRGIVPLSVIDELDTLKKGNANINQRARDAIRYLDKTMGGGDSDPVRAQRATEKLSSWSMAQKYLVPKKKGGSGSGEALEDPAHVDESQVATRSASDVHQRYRAALSLCISHLPNLENTGTDQSPIVTNVPSITAHKSASEPAIILATTDTILVGFARRFGIVTWTKKHLVNALKEERSG